MIKAKELIIGNHVFDVNGNLIKVESISEKGINLEASLNIDPVIECEYK